MNSANPERVINFVCNATKKNYVKLIGHYTFDEIDDIHKFMIKFGICSSNDKIIHSVRQKENGIGTKYHDISFIKFFYDIFNDPKKMMKVNNTLSNTPKNKNPKGNKKKKRFRRVTISD